MGILDLIFGQRLRVRVQRSPASAARPMTEQERREAIARFLEMPVADQMAQSGRLASLLRLTDSTSRDRK